MTIRRRSVFLGAWLVVVATVVSRESSSPRSSPPTGYVDVGYTEEGMSELTYPDDYVDPRVLVTGPPGTYWSVAMPLNPLVTAILPHRPDRCPTCACSPDAFC